MAFKNKYNPLLTNGLQKILDFTKIIEYNIDLSSSYTNRTLVDKEYVDDAIVSSQPTFQQVVDKSISVDGYVYADFGAGQIEDDGGQLAILSHANKDFLFGADGIFTVNFSGGTQDVNMEDKRAIKKGIEYHDDYSANFTDRSLVDKEYVDNKIISGVTASNGLHEDGTDIKLGGVLTEDTIVQGNAELYFRAGDLNNGTNEYSVEFSPLADDQLQFFANDGTNHTEFTMFPTDIYYSASNGTADNTILVSTTDMIITDGINNKGIKYADDYSGNFTDRSLIDKEYVDNSLLSQNNTWQQTIDNQLNGGTYMYTTFPSAEIEDDGSALIISSFANKEFSFGSSNVGRFTFSGVTNNAIYTDARTGIDQRGLEYADNYSASFTDRSLVDKEYVDNNKTIHTILSKTANYTLLATDDYIELDGSSATVLLTMSTLTASEHGKEFIIDVYNIDNAVTLNVNSSTETLILDETRTYVWNNTRSKYRRIN